MNIILLSDYTQELKGKKGSHSFTWKKGQLLAIKGTEGARLISQQNAIEVKHAALKLSLSQEEGETNDHYYHRITRDYQQRILKL